MTAIQEGNAEVVRALISAPDGSRVTPAVREQMDQMQAEQSNPQAFRPSRN